MSQKQGKPEEIIIDFDQTMAHMHLFTKVESYFSNTMMRKKRPQKYSKKGTNRENSRPESEKNK